MNRHVDYYLAPQSPWTYLGHERLAAMAAAAGATVRLLPVDLGKVFPMSGGLPLAKRAPQRQAYRLVELKRFSEHLAIPMNVQPKFFPVAGDDAARLIVAVDLADGPAAGMKIAGAILKAVWAQERNIADTQLLAQLLAEQGLPAQRLAQSRGAPVQERYEANTREAMERGVFGAPTYAIDGELFWGQDRLDFVQRRLQA
ncbi:2-hydroxychromene-2-carboxylate isomerase [Ramlibacter sp.]|uniref:2-hydroxychromene-2-carboxylate isomerase n=1 Tax=Ramlibacter sp. TaxID=1917967 RepID=UPI002C787C53|nr:2-hydroxychromene-2-carboxylate isomerase [Ramlibacter sp.]HWI83747.1 2-hydroxychromene-2-carboxylate isomerase [Ramlibacter sp.]